MGGAVSTEYAGLKNRSFALDNFLDLLLSIPGFDVVLHVHHFQVDLVKDRLRAILLVQNRGDTSAQHVVGAHFLAGRLLSILPSMHGLFTPLKADFFSFALAGDERDLLSIGKFPL